MRAKIILGICSKTGGRQECKGSCIRIESDSPSVERVDVQVKSHYSLFESHILHEVARGKLLIGWMNKYLSQTCSCWLEILHTYANNILGKTAWFCIG